MDMQPIFLWCPLLRIYLFGRHFYQRTFFPIPEDFRLRESWLYLNLMSCVTRQSALPPPTTALDVRRTRTIRVASVWILCNFRIWEASWTSWQFASISCDSFESHCLIQVPQVDLASVWMPSDLTLNSHKWSTSKISLFIQYPENR